MVLNLRNSLVSHPKFASAARACRRACGATSSSNFCFCPFCCLKKVCRMILRPPLALVCIFTTSACSSAAAMCSSSAPVSFGATTGEAPAAGAAGPFEFGVRFVLKLLPCGRTHNLSKLYRSNPILNLERHLNPEVWPGPYNS